MLPEHMHHVFEADESLFAHIPTRSRAVTPPPTARELCSDAASDMPTQREGTVCATELADDRRLTDHDPRICLSLSIEEVQTLDVSEQEGELCGHRFNNREALLNRCTFEKKAQAPPLSRWLVPSHGCPPRGNSDCGPVVIRHYASEVDVDPKDLPVTTPRSGDTSRRRQLTSLVFPTPEVPATRFVACRVTALPRSSAESLFMASLAIEMDPDRLSPRPSRPAWKFRCCRAALLGLPS